MFSTGDPPIVDLRVKEDIFIHKDKVVERRKRLEYQNKGSNYWWPLTTVRPEIIELKEIEDLKYYSEGVRLYA